MRRPGGYAVVINPTQGFLRLDDPNARAEQTSEGMLEFDSFTCGHCGGVRHVRAREKPEDTGGLCKQCMHLICPKCLGTGRCDPLEAKLERQEKKSAAIRSYGLAT